MQRRWIRQIVNEPTGQNESRKSATLVKVNSTNIKHEV